MENRLFVLLGVQNSYVLLLNRDNLYKSFVGISSCIYNIYCFQYRK
jgi:hypothetical protein